MFLAWRARRKRFDSEIVLTYALLYAGVRFLIEYFQGDEDRGFVFIGLLSTSELTAILLSIISSILLVNRINDVKRSLGRVIKRDLLAGMW